MDFGEILSQWENSKKQETSNTKNTTDSKKNISNKKANADFIEKGFATKAQAEESLKQSKKNIQEQIEQDNKQKINPMELWLRRYGVVDKDKVIAQYEQTKKMQEKDYIKNMPIDASIDLHGLTKEQAWTRLDTFTQECIHRGLKKIMFIHGKGNHATSNDPVLGELVRLYIEKNPRLGASGHPSRAQGGTGATWVLIKEVKRK